MERQLAAELARRLEGCDAELEGGSHIGSESDCGAAAAAAAEPPTIRPNEVWCNVVYCSVV